MRKEFSINDLIVDIVYLKSISIVNELNLAQI